MNEHSDQIPAHRDEHMLNLAHASGHATFRSEVAALARAEFERVEGCESSQIQPPAPAATQEESHSAFVMARMKSFHESRDPNNPLREQMLSGAPWRRHLSPSIEPSVRSVTDEYSGGFPEVAALRTRYGDVIADAVMTDILAAHDQPYRRTRRQRTSGGTQVGIAERLTSLLGPSPAEQRIFPDDSPATDNTVAAEPALHDSLSDTEQSPDVTSATLANSSHRAMNERTDAITRTEAIKRLLERFARLFKQ